MKVLFFHRNAEWLGIEYLSSALKKAQLNLFSILVPVTLNTSLSFWTVFLM